ncbi:MAG: hypothetical protein [Caudoviricetes sp.]|nr:MAG: hypothetical protein [Caudoviricetes sp.]
MSRKTLKQKLKRESRELKQVIAHQHELAGITINFELRKSQSISMAHGVSATLFHVQTVLKNVGVDVEKDPAYLEIQQMAQARIAQCAQVLIDCGLTPAQINEHIRVGH